MMGVTSVAGFQMDSLSTAAARALAAGDPLGALNRVTRVDGELWHGTWEGDESDLMRVDPRTGEVLERLEMPPRIGVSGLESDDGDQFFCGG
jgi:glutamine cyclotransferase